jgi:hypothetical protein
MSHKISEAELQILRMCQLQCGSDLPVDDCAIAKVGSSIKGAKL